MSRVQHHPRTACERVLLPEQSDYNHHQPRRCLQGQGQFSDHVIRQNTMIQVPKTEHKYLLTALDSIRMQIQFQLMIGPKTRSGKHFLDNEDITILAILGMNDQAITIQKLCKDSFPELFGNDSESGVKEHIRFQQIRNRINRLIQSGYIIKKEDASNRRNKLIRFGDRLQISKPEHSMIVYKLFTPHAPNQAQAAVAAHS